MAHDKDHDPHHPEKAGAGEEGAKPESAEKTAEAVGDQRKKTKGEVKGVFGRVWDAFKDGVKKAIQDAGYVTGVLEHPKDRGEGEAPEAEEKHDKAHKPEPKKEDAPKAEGAKNPVHDDVQGEQGDTEASGDNDEGAPAEGEAATTAESDSAGPEGEEISEGTATTSEATAGTDNDEAPVKTKVETNEPAKSATKDAVPPAEGGEGKPAEKPEEPAHDKNHGAKDAHGAHANEGMSTGTKVALGVAGTTVVLGALATAGAVAVASEITQTTIEHGPKWFQTAGNFIKWPFRATGKFLGHLAGTPVAELKDGFAYGAEEFVGEADYEELEGWTAPWKAVKNMGRSLVRNPITRTIAGAGFGALGFLGGIFKGGVEGGVDAFSEENKPTWEMPWKRTRKAKPKKEKKPKKTKADAHGHGADSHGHGKDAHGHAKDEHKDEHAKPDHADPHAKDEHKDDHAKPAHATEPAHAEPAAHHRLAA